MGFESSDPFTGLRKLIENPRLRCWATFFTKRYPMRIFIGTPTVHGNGTDSTLSSTDAVHGTNDGSVVHTDDGSVVHMDDGSVVRTDDGSVVHTDDGSSVRTIDVSGIVPPGSW